MITAFGPTAERYANALGDIDAIVCEPSFLIAALVEGIRRRAAGESFYGMLLMDELRARVIAMVAPSILDTFATLDERLVAFQQLEHGVLPVNGRPISELFAAPDPSFRQVAAEFLTLPDCWIVRSHAEYARVAALVARPRPYERFVAEPAVPAVDRVRSGGPSIVVWAPQLPSAQLRHHVFAFAEFRGEVTFVTADGEAVENPQRRFVTAADAAGPLAGADAVATIDADDPGAAIAFARAGYGILAPVTAGAGEYVRDVVTYAPGALRTIQVGASMAVARRGGVRDVPAAPPRLVRPPLPLPLEALPLVSVIIPTYNRRDDVRAALECIAEQTYPNIEAVVVNDAGAAVDDIVAAFGFARLHDLTENGGAIRAVMRGLDVARGEFVQFLADDDVLYPDHIERLMDALLRTGGSVAHGNAVIRHQKRLDDGALLTVGYNNGIFNDTATPSEALISTPIAGQALLWRRSVFEQIGGWREDSSLADQEIQLRAADAFVFVYVDAVTNEWRVRGTSNFSANTDSAVEMERIFEVLHPRPDRPILTERRRRTLANVAARPKGYVFGPSVQLA